MRAKYKKCDYQDRWAKERCKHRYFATGTDPHTGSKADFCIFHAPMDLKPGADNYDRFWEEFARYFARVEEELKEAETEEAKAEVILNCRGFVFPGTGDFFKYPKFPFAADFSDAQFSGDADFSWAQFSGDADFRGAHFSGAADFWRAKFSGDANFSGAQFSGDAKFSDAQFSGAADFSWAQFSGAADFRDAQFSGAAYFQFAQFSEDADFWGAQFSGAAYFRGTIFGEGADLRGARVSKVVADPSTVLGLSKLYDLEAAKDVTLGGLETDRPVVFTATARPNIIKVINCRFDSYFEVRAPFASVELNDSVFNKPVLIEPGAKDTTFSSNGARFYDHIKVKGCKLSGLTDVYLDKRMTLTDVDAREAIFENTDLKRVDFERCKLAEVRRPRFFFFWKSSEGLFAEEKDLGRRGCFIRRFLEGIRRFWRPRKDTVEKAKDLADQYRAITANFEDRRRYGLAGAFYAGEREMHRIYGGWRDKIVLTLFRAISFYGEDYVTPLVLLAVGLPLFCGVLYAFTGVPGSKLHDLDLVNPFTRVYSWTAAKGVIKAIWEGAKFTVTAIAFIPTKPMREAGTHVGVITAFARVLGAIFVTTFLFALRRRFRR